MGSLQDADVDLPGRFKNTPKVTNIEGNPKPHYHLNTVGQLEACYHRCRNLLSPGFWIGMTFGFPVEHLLWEKAPVFSALTHWMGL